MNLSEHTVERISLYKRVLSKYLDREEPHIYSHDLAKLLHITPAQVRRDLMLIGFNGNHRKGYNIKDLVKLIDLTLENKEAQNVAFVGMGNIGKAAMNYFIVHKTNLKIVAGFDIDPLKVNTFISGIECFHIEDMFKIIKEKNISIAVLTVPSEYAEDIARVLVIAGIKGILNFTPVRLLVPANIFLEEYDFVTSLEKISYFLKQNNK